MRIVLALALLAVPVVAVADSGPIAPAKDDGTSPPAPPPPPVTDQPTTGPVFPSRLPPERYTHRHQLGLSLRLPIGLRAIVTYKDTDYCGSTSETGAGYATACLGLAPIPVDLELSYGVADSVELLVETRFGITRDFPSKPGLDDGPREVQLAPGARFFFSESGRSKLFLTTQLVLDFTDYKDGSGAARGTEIGGRSIQGWWLDLHRAYGFYVFVGETAIFGPWIDIDLEAGIGIQGRYP